MVILEGRLDLVRIARSAILVVISLMSWSFVQAADPVVQHVNMAQRIDGSSLVDITYDVSDADGDTVAVTLQLSSNGGISWYYPVLNVSGDLGQGIVPGQDKKIVWDAGRYAPRVYIYKLIGNGQAASNRMILMR